MVLFAEVGHMECKLRLLHNQLKTLCGTINTHFPVKWRCSFHGCLSVSALSSCDGNMTPWSWFSPFRVWCCDTFWSSEVLFQSVSVQGERLNERIYKATTVRSSPASVSVPDLCHLLVQYGAYAPQPLLSSTLEKLCNWLRCLLDVVWWGIWSAAF